MSKSLHRLWRLKCQPILEAIAAQGILLSPEGEDEVRSLIWESRIPIKISPLAYPSIDMTSEIVMHRCITPDGEILSEGPDIQAAVMAAQTALKDVGS